MQNPNGQKVFEYMQVLLGSEGVYPHKKVALCKKYNAMKASFQLAAAKMPWTPRNSCRLWIYRSEHTHNIRLEGVVPTLIPRITIGIAGRDLHDFDLGAGKTGRGMVYKCDDGLCGFDIELVGGDVKESTAQKLIEMILHANGPVDVLKKSVRAKRARLSKPEMGDGGMPADQPGAGGAGYSTEEDEDEENERKQTADEFQAAIAKVDADQETAKVAVDKVTAIRVAVQEARAVVEADDKKAKETAEKAASDHALAEKAKQAATEAINKAVFSDRHARDATKALHESKIKARAAAEALVAAEADAKQALDKSSASAEEARIVMDRINKAALTKSEAKAQADARALALAGAGPAGAGPAAVVHAPALAALATVAVLVASAAPAPAPAPAPVPAVKSEMVDLTGDDDE